MDATMEDKASGTYTAVYTLRDIKNSTLEGRIIDGAYRVYPSITYTLYTKLKGSTDAGSYKVETFGGVYSVNTLNYETYTNKLKFNNVISVSNLQKHTINHNTQSGDQFAFWCITSGQGSYNLPVVGNEKEVAYAYCIGGTATANAWCNTIMTIDYEPRT